MTPKDEEPSAAVTSGAACARASALSGPAQGLSRAGSASSRPSANSGIRHSDGTGPATPVSCIMVWMVTRTSRRALANISRASGSSAARAETRLMVKPREP
jgi:hypothetical protein